MPSDGELLKFFGRRKVQVPNLARKAQRLRNVEVFQKAAEDLELQIVGSKIYFYGTKRMQLGHEKSHLNMFVDVGES